MRIRIGLFAASAMLIAPIASAQQGAGEIEEVVVTARKQEEKIQDVPLTISAFTATEIRERGLADVMDISQFTPVRRLDRVGQEGLARIRATSMGSRRLHGKFQHRLFWRRLHVRLRCGPYFQLRVRRRHFQPRCGKRPA